MPPLAQDRIETDFLNQRRPDIVLKRIQYKDAGIQKNTDEARKIVKEELVQTDDQSKKRNKNYKSTDVSTATEVTPLKSRPV
jgi:hypothetical protein